MCDVVFPSSCLLWIILVSFGNSPLFKNSIVACNASERGREFIQNFISVRDERGVIVICDVIAWWSYVVSQIYIFLDSRCANQQRSTKHTTYDVEWNDIKRSTLGALPSVLSSVQRWSFRFLPVLLNQILIALEIPSVRGGLNLLKNRSRDLQLLYSPRKWWCLRNNPNNI